MSICALSELPATMHSTDYAIIYKWVGHLPSGAEKQRYADDSVLKLRAEARANPEVRADGRVANYDYRGQKHWYDENGVDEDGFYADGESATPGAVNREGWRVERSLVTGRLRAYDKDGFDRRGRDREGYNRRGFNRAGFNRYGFNLEGIHPATGTNIDPEGYNFYGVDQKVTRVQKNFTQMWPWRWSC